MILKTEPFLNFTYGNWHDRPLAELPGVKVKAASFNAKLCQVSLELQLPFSVSNRLALEQELLAFVRNHKLALGLSSEQEIKNLTLSLHCNISERTKVTATPAQGVKNIIAVSSAKGGVGKSSVCVNLALALAKSGAKVGILDADIYGPSIPHMLGKSEAQPTSLDQKTMQPIAAHGIYANSIGFLVGEEDPTIWRGPIASQYLQQLLVETNWPDLDYLLIDMPPGTGDIQLTVAQKLGVTAALVVSTPQEIALLDVLKGINMFNTLNVPVLGIVENMSMYTCPNCGHQAHIFGQEGVHELAEFLLTPVLASLPLNMRMGLDLDQGNATVVKEPTHELSEIFFELADRVSFELYDKVKSASKTIEIKQL